MWLRLVLRVWNESKNLWFVLRVTELGHSRTERRIFGKIGLLILIKSSPIHAKENEGTPFVSYWLGLWEQSGASGVCQRELGFGRGNLGAGIWGAGVWEKEFGEQELGAGI